MWEEAGKMRTRITPNTDTFYAVRLPGTHMLIKIIEKTTAFGLYKSRPCYYTQNFELIPTNEANNVNYSKWTKFPFPAHEGIKDFSKYFFQCFQLTHKLHNYLFTRLKFSDNFLK